MSYTHQPLSIVVLAGVVVTRRRSATNTKAGVGAPARQLACSTALSLGNQF